MPESERWKESVKRSGAARPLREIFSGGLLPTALLGIAFAAVALIGTWGSVQSLPAWADKLTDGAVPKAKALTQIISGLGSVAGCFFGAWIGAAVGRRAT